MAQMTMKIGSMIVAFTVVAEMKADSTRLITRKLHSTPLALLPNLITKASASRLANCVFTSIEASTKLRMLSHITGWPSWASASFCVVTLNRTTSRMRIREVR